MASSLINPGLSFATDKAIVASRRALAKVGVFSTDFSDDAVKVGTTLKIPVYSVGTANAFNAASNNYGTTDGSIGYASVAFNNHVKYTFQFDDADANLVTQNGVWANAGKAAGASVSKAIESAVMGLFTYASAKAQVTSSVSKASFAALRADCAQNDLDPADCVVILTPTAFTLWRRSVEKAKEEFKSLFDLLQKNIANKIIDNNKRIADSFKAVADAVENATDKMEHQSEIADMKTSNARTLRDAKLEAQRASELSQEGNAGKRAEINERYDRIKVENSLADKTEDAKTQSARIYNSTIANNYAMQQKGLAENMRTQESTIVAARSNVNNLQVASKSDKMSEEEQKKAAEDLIEAQRKLREEEERLNELKQKSEILTREENQAKEKSLQALAKIEVAQAESETQRALLDDAHNQRYFAEQEKANKGNGTTTEWGTSTTVSEGLNDRISKLGGFATIGAKNAAGIVVDTEVEKQIKQSEKQTSELQKQTEELKKITRNTEDSVATFQ